MKKIVFILVLICSLFAHNSQANAENIENSVNTYDSENVEYCTYSGLSKQDCKNALLFYNQKKSAINKIEEETQICLDKGFAMQNCNYEAVNKYKTEISNLINDYKKILPKDMYNKLLLSQKAWEEYYKNNAVIHNEIMNTKKGTIAYTIFSGLTVNCIKNRLEELLNIYHSYITLE